MLIGVENSPLNEEIGVEKSPLEKVPPETDSGIPKGEMTTEETVHRIRLDHKQGKKIKQIARLRRMDPKTVRKIVNSNEPRIEYNRKQIHYRELGPFKARLEELLSENIALKPKQRRKFVHLHGDLQAEGFRGSYDCVRRFCSKWMKTQDSASNPEETPASKAYTPLSFEPGEAFQFDWGSEVILLDGASTRVSVAHVTLAYSRMSFPRIYRRESLEMVLDAHEKAFTFFKGVCEFGIYDNMTTAVKKVLTGKDRLWNLSFEEYQRTREFVLLPAIVPQAGKRGVLKGKWESVGTTSSLAKNAKGTKIWKPSISSCSIMLSNKHVDAPIRNNRTRASGRCS